jgi:hypothetical protein
MNPYTFQVARERITPFMYETKCFLKEKAKTEPIKANLMLTVFENKFDQNYSSFTYTSSTCSLLKGQEYADLKRELETTMDKAEIEAEIQSQCAKLYPRKEDVKKQFQELDYKTSKKIQDEYKKSGSKKSMADWYSGFKETESGKLLLGAAKTGIASLWDKAFGTSASDEAMATALANISNPKEKKQTNLPLNMSPITFGLVSVATLGVIVTLIVLVAKSK